MYKGLPQHRHVSTYATSLASSIVSLCLIIFYCGFWDCAKIRVGICIALWNLHIYLYMNMNFYMGQGISKYSTTQKMCGLLVLRNLCLLYHQSQTLEYCKTFKRIKKNKQTWNEWNQIQHFKASTCLSLCCHSVSWGQRAGSCASAFESRLLIGWFARPTLPWTNQSEAWSSKHLCFQNTFHMIWLIIYLLCRFCPQNWSAKSWTDALRTCRLLLTL